jgi:formate C-acetyltransferase
MNMPLWNTFDAVRPQLERQYLEPPYDPASGVSLEQLRRLADPLLHDKTGQSRMAIRAALFERVVTQGRVGIDPVDWFAGHLEHGNLLIELRERWRREIAEKMLAAESAEIAEACRAGRFETELDLSHTSPDWFALLELGLPGLRDRAAVALESAVDDEAKDFLSAVIKIYNSAIVLLLRLAEQAEKYLDSERMRQVAAALRNLAVRPPATLQEAFQLAYIYHELQEMEGENVRSMGGFDRLYLKFYRDDLASGRLTRDQAKELLKFFWIKFYAQTQGRQFGKNFYFGGLLSEAVDGTNELSRLGYEVYREMRTVDPKLSLRLNRKTPPDFLRQVAACVRSGLTGTVFANDEVIIPQMLQQGKTAEDAYEYTLIGCYEPAVMGKELCCSMAIRINLAKFIEDAMEDEATSFEEFERAYFNRLGNGLSRALELCRRWERHWPEINPSPWLSGTMSDCIARGRDVSCAGANYNTTGVMCAAMANAADSLLAVKTLVCDKKLCTLTELRSVLAADWEGYEELHAVALRVPKWGNNDPAVDAFGIRISDFVTQRINRQPNARHGYFQAALFSINYNHIFGERTGALPDGRRRGEPLAKNTGAMTALDKNGVTSLINSATKLDYSHYPDGAVLDVMLHPTAVQGEDGLDALVALIRTFADLGGMAIQFNIFDAKELRNAQLHPEQYANLQVRVCGWNVRFIDLAPAEQTVFITQAEGTNR